MQRESMEVGGQGSIFDVQGSGCGPTCQLATCIGRQEAARDDTRPCRPDNAP